MCRCSGGLHSSASSSRRSASAPACSRCSRSCRSTCRTSWQLAARRGPSFPSDHCVRVHRPARDAEAGHARAYVAAALDEPRDRVSRRAPDGTDLARIGLDGAPRRIRRLRDRHRAGEPDDRGCCTPSRRPCSHRDGLGISNTARITGLAMGSPSSAPSWSIALGLISRRRASTARNLQPGSARPACGPRSAIRH
jgi:hypothetical protein